MRLAIILPLRNQSELTNLLKRLYDPSSPDYRHFLTVAQFTQQFGPTTKDYEAVVKFAKSKGFSVTNTPSNRLLVDMNGTVSQINKAFHVAMTNYRHPKENRTFYSSDREPSLDLSVPVAHIAGLNNFSLPRPKFKRAPANFRRNSVGSGPSGAYLGSDMRAAYYGGTALTGSGQTVGLLEFDGYNMSDVTASFAGQPSSVLIRNVLLDGASAASDGDDGEQVLDIVQAASMAPGLSQIRVYIAPGTSQIGVGDVDIFNEMATENIAKQLSCSWGWNPDDTAQLDPIFQEFAAQGQNLFVASGDAGAYTGSNSTDDGYPRGIRLRGCRRRNGFDHEWRGRSLAIRNGVGRQQRRPCRRWLRDSELAGWRGQFLQPGFHNSYAMFRTWLRKRILTIMPATKDPVQETMAAPASPRRDGPAFLRSSINKWWPTGSQLWGSLTQPSTRLVRAPATAMTSTTSPAAVMASIRQSRAMTWSLAGAVQTAPA